MTLYLGHSSAFSSHQFLHVAFNVIKSGWIAKEGMKIRNHAVQIV